MTIGRCQLPPDAGQHFLSKDGRAKAAANYLEDEIRQRVARGTIRFNVMLQLAAPGDKIDDPSVAWANTNKITTLGTLTVASVAPESAATERALLFLPALLPARIDSGPDDSVPQQDVSGIVRAPSSISMVEAAAGVRMNSSCRLMALRDVLRRRSNSVAFGAKRTWTGRQDRRGRSKMTQSAHSDTRGDG